MSTANRDLGDLSYKALVKLEKEIVELKAKKQAEERDHLLEKLQSMARDSGLTVQDLLGKTRRGARGKATIAKTSNGKGRKKIAIRYRNPENSDETWTGRGRAPRWLAAKLKGGAAREDFAVR